MKVSEWISILESLKNRDAELCIKNLDDEYYDIIEIREENIVMLDEYGLSQNPEFIITVTI